MKANLKSRVVLAIVAVIMMISNTACNVGPIVFENGSFNLDATIAERSQAEEK